ncbi:MAG: expansin EXLX1 family cellulose-binding protein [Eubacteriales bacterium]|nr:expansin EXLX1 family cellulose-binding protein [Eubacteriales bacterium]
MKKIITVLFALVLILGVLGGNEQVNAATKVRLNKTKVTLAVGKKVTLKMKGTKKKVKWSSSNKKVATVSSKGAVRAKKEGKATVTAKVGTKKYKCKVNVKKAYVPQNVKPGEPSQKTVNYDAGEYSIRKVHKGEATFYEFGGGGAANLDYLSESFYTAAMNHEDYMNGLAGAYVEVTDKDGDKIYVVITDRLPEGKKGDIDLDRKAFKAIEPEVTGRMQITWKIVPFPTKEPISYVFKPTSTKWWAEVQVRNGRYPIKKLEYKNAKGNFVELERQEYNYFTAPSGMGDGPYTFRVTDFYGHVLEDSGITIHANGTPVAGSANFPY